MSHGPVAPLYQKALAHLADKPIITIATGATCAYLGDERNLREFLVADETARHLRAAGHTVFSLLINDSLDPLNYRQLRVGVNKDEKLLTRFEAECGKPIAHVADPWGCHGSYAAHFEAALLDRLHALDCHPALVSTANLYARGVYAPYVGIILERHDAVRAFLEAQFPGYHPDKLFWPLCPDCGYLDQTRVEAVSGGTLHAHCARCDQSSAVPVAHVRGKLNWKLDCAARWAIFGVDAEPFNKAYLEPQAGAYVVAGALHRRFFDGRQDVFPLQYGLVEMEKALGYTLLDSLPGALLRDLFVQKPSTDLHLTTDFLVTAASRQNVLPDLSYLNFVKQVLPLWQIAPDALSPAERDLAVRGACFARHFLNAPQRPRLPGRELFEEEQPAVLHALGGLVAEALRLRGESAPDLSYADFHAAIKPCVDELGFHKRVALHRLRLLIGQEQGLPASRVLFLLPLDYLRHLAYLLELHQTAETPLASRARLLREEIVPAAA